MDAFLLQVKPTITELKQSLALAHKEYKQHKDTGSNNEHGREETTILSLGKQFLLPRGKNA